MFLSTPPPPEPQLSHVCQVNNYFVTNLNVMNDYDLLDKLGVLVKLSPTLPSN